MVNYLFLRLILRMERTTNPSVEVPSDAAIAAAITAISSELSASCTGAAATGAGVGAEAASSAALQVGKQSLELRSAAAVHPYFCC